MKNTYVKCADWSWEDKLLYIKECIGEDIPHNKICGHATLSKDDLLSLYRFAHYIYCLNDGMIVYDGQTKSPDIGVKTEVKLSGLKPNPTKFVKVEESIFDLKEEFERGELFTKKAWGEYVLIKEDTHLALLYEMQSHENSKIGIYRQVEIDWRDEVKSKYSLTDFRNLDNEGCINLGDWTPEGFIKLCHFVAELTDKPE